MILLEEAVARFNSAAKPYGVHLARRRGGNRARGVVERLGAEVEPLRMPAELRAFLATYDPSTIQRPVLDGFIALEELSFRREIDCPPAPAILYPIADWTQSRIWIELESRNHPGGRVFHSYHDETEVSLWTFGISGLLDLLSAALERDLIDDARGTLDANHFETLIARRLDSVIGTEMPRRFEAVDRSKYPPHWQHAEGLTIDHFTLRGATHNVAELKAARINQSHLEATLVGRFEAGVGGGPLAGHVGRFSDETGTFQVFVPNATAVNGSVGPRGEVEIDIVAMPSDGVDIDVLTAPKELAEALARGWNISDHSDVLDRLFAQLQTLDTSVIVTAMRPVS